MTEDTKPAQDPIITDVPFGVSDPGVEAEFDKYLMEVDGEDEEEYLAPKMAEEEAPEEESPEADPAEGESEEQPEPEETEGGDLETSLAALRRDGLPQNVIDKMTDEEILALGAKRAKVQGDTDNAFRELQELKTGKETATESDEDSPVHAEPAEQPSFVDLDTAVQPFVDTFGDEAGETLKKALQATVQPVLAQFKAQQDVVEQMLVAANRQTLSEKFPGMADDEQYARVNERMHTLVKSGEYTDMSALMADAARLEFADESAAISQELQTKLARDKAGGQVMPGGKAETPDTSLDEDEREDALLDALEGGMDIDAAKRMYGRAQPIV